MMPGVHDIVHRSVCNWYPRRCNHYVIKLNLPALSNVIMYANNNRTVHAEQPKRKNIANSTNTENRRIANVSTTVFSREGQVAQWVELFQIDAYGNYNIRLYIRARVCVWCGPVYTGRPMKTEKARATNKQNNQRTHIYYVVLSAGKIAIDRMAKDVRRAYAPNITNKSIVANREWFEMVRYHLLAISIIGVERNEE